MSNLRVVNTAPGEEQLPYFATIHTKYDDRLDSLISTPNSSPTPYSRPESPFGRVLERDDERYIAEPTDPLSFVDSFNLEPPPPGYILNSLEVLTERLFSADHLDTILSDQLAAIRFTGFLDTYLPHFLPLLRQYSEAAKAAKAVDYANAIVRQIGFQSDHSIDHAAKLDDQFQAKKNQLVRELVDRALPAHLTQQLVSLVTDTMVKEITGNSAPVVRTLIPSLAEVYCISDPSLPDNPVVYASEEFYNTTLYDRETVIGRNCRFLQGPMTSASSVRRLVTALAQGEECCETILNYKRDGTPFMNLLLIVPLYDNTGTARYFLGCLIDVSSLIEGGNGIESFARLLAEDCSRTRSARWPGQNDPSQSLHELGQLLSPQETDALSKRSRRMSASPSHSLASRVDDTPGSRSSRIILGMDSPAPESQLWPHRSLGYAGRVPGVYQNYLLVRPYPSLRITFTSPTLRIPGMLQAKLLDRIGGPESVRAGLVDAFMQGTSVTAKITWLTAGSDSLDHGKVRWIHCTPLLGSDERVGVWMVVMVENELITGGLNRHSQVISPAVDSVQSAQHSTGANLYADYLRRAGRHGTRGTLASTSSTRERRTFDEAFRDF